jgi:hypothetical protein
MTRVALRTMTEKSTFKFGKYADLTVRQLIQLKGLTGIRYIRWVYFSMSNISFNEEILKEIGIHEAIRIQKPGKVKEDEIAGYLAKVIHTSQTEEMKKVVLAQSWGFKRAAKRKMKFLESRINKKSRNQNKNHNRKF